MTWSVVFRRLCARAWCHLTIRWSLNWHTMDNYRKQRQNINYWYSANVFVICSHEHQLYKPIPVCSRPTTLCDSGKQCYFREEKKNIALNKTRMRTKRELKGQRSESNLRSNDKSAKRQRNVESLRKVVFLLLRSTLVSQLLWQMKRETETKGMRSLFFLIRGP